MLEMPCLRAHYVAISDEYAAFIFAEAADLRHELITIEIIITRRASTRSAAPYMISR